MGYFYVILLAGLAIYLFFMAMAAKSKLFHSPFVKEGKEAQYTKTARIGVFCMAGVLLLLAIVNFIAVRTPDGAAALETLSVINLVLTLVLLTGMLVILFLLTRMQDKQKKSLPAKSVAPRAAFYFDDGEDSESPAPQQRKKKKK